MRVGVDSERCQGHGRCNAVSEFFTLDDDGYSNIGPAKDVPTELEPDVHAGISACPEFALELTEEDAR